MDVLNLDNYFDLTKHGFDPGDFTIEGVAPGVAKEFHGNLGCTYTSPNTFEVDSQQLNEPPYTLTHDGEKVTSCQCLWYVNHVKPSLEQGLAPRKYCAHWVRASLVFIRKRIREDRTAAKVQAEPAVPVTTEPVSDATPAPARADDVRGHLNYVPFNLFR